MGIPKVKEEVDEFIKTLDDLLRNSDQMKKKELFTFLYMMQDIYIIRLYF